MITVSTRANVVTLEDVYRKLFKDAPMEELLNPKGTVYKGPNVAFRVTSDESPIFLRWIYEQTNKTHALKYLIEQEILEHGIRDLSMIIPTKRESYDLLQKKLGFDNITDVIEYLLDNAVSSVENDASSKLVNFKEVPTSSSKYIEPELQVKDTLDADEKKQLSNEFKQSDKTDYQVPNPVKNIEPETHSPVDVKDVNSNDNVSTEYNPEPSPKKVEHEKVSQKPTTIVENNTGSSLQNQSQQKSEKPDEMSEEEKAKRLTGLF